MKVSSKLKKLAKEFENKNHHLYIVGGFVRDSLLGYKPSDIDLTSSMKISDVLEICKKLNYSCKIVNKNLGTILISTPKEKYEFTTFRKESYTTGKHSPDSIEFVDDISVDAKRRDLSINAMFYDIQKDQIIDLVDGIKHLKKGKICTANTPSITLKDDGLRILRCLRFAITFNFRIEKNTLDAIKYFKSNLANISKERILGELRLLVIADLKYNKSNNIFWKYLVKLNLLPYIFNHSLTRLAKINKKYIKNFYNISKNERLVYFYLIVIKHYLKDYAKHNQLTFAINMILGIDGIKESNSTIHLVEKLYLIYQNIENNIDRINATINYMGLLEENKNLIISLLSDQAKKRLQEDIEVVRLHNLPIGINQLKITAKDLLDNNIESKYISKILTTLYNQVLEFKVENKKSNLLNLAIEINKTFLEISKPKN